MRKRIIDSVGASIVTTLIILAINFLIMLFSSAEIGRRTAYFGAVFFDATPISSDTIDMSVGIDNITPIIITFIIFTGIYYSGLRLINKNRKSY
ncbi:hypothetical protein [Salinicoccus bachuensis]|uniref:Uncharacterized protein n=1 Tax=Salinicoccus bachuensis TaxID=3136731 RepID=A0ABZ3CI37_9STAP